MTLDYYIYEIKHLIPELDVPDRLIIRWINQQRALWLKNELNKNRTIEDNIKQTLSGLELILSDESELRYIKTNHRVLKTKLELPRTINRHYGDTIISVRNSLILSENYNYITREESVYAGNGKLNKKDIFAFLYNDRIYIKIPKENSKVSLLTHISVEGVFEDPLEVSKYYFGGEPCYNPSKQDYPINDSTWVYMKEEIIKNGLRKFESDNQDQIQT